MEISDSDYDTCDSDEDKNEYTIVQYRVLNLSDHSILINKELYDNIQSLPRELRHRLYIRTMREYWKDQGISMISRVPSWRASAIKQETLLFDARHKNIHFLHLPCNTLPEYKTYIIGCQCNYCLYRAHPIEKIRKQRLNSESFLYFYKTVPNTESNWNDRIEQINDNVFGLPIFNPDYDSI